MYLMFLIDSLRHDFVTEKNAPFLHELSQKGALVRLKPTLAYEGRPAFFSGLYPKSSNVAFRYIYNPRVSPYKLAPVISALPLPSRYRRRLLLLVSRKLSRSPLVQHLGFREIPISLVKYFGFGESQYHWEPGYLGEKITLFDILRKIGEPWVVNSWPSPKYGLSYNGTVNAYVDAIRRYGSKLFFFYSTIADTDWAEHKYGPESEEMDLYLQVMDRTVEVIFNDAKRRSRTDPSLFVFGDHGAVSVKKILNMERLIVHLPLKLGKEFVYFIDSALVRFWFNSDGARRHVEEMLSEDCKDYGHILTDAEFSGYHFNVDRSLRGDIFFLADPGVLIFPNFHNRNIPEKGMHGYDPEYEDEWAAGVIYMGTPFKLRTAEKYETIDIFPTISKMLGVEQNLDIDGRSIIYG